tara:strand:+ start:87 stop:443 length:357 start_codon:yes stop_codon:yes gene_type:complete
VIFDMMILLFIIIIIITLSLYEFESFSYLRLYRYDEIIHFIMYLFLALFAGRSTRFKSHSRNGLILLIILLLPLLTEFFQYYTPQRRPDLSDLFYDYYGLLAGIIIILLYRYVAKSKH